MRWVHPAGGQEDKEEACVSGEKGVRERLREEDVFRNETPVHGPFVEELSIELEGTIYIGTPVDFDKFKCEQSLELSAQHLIFIITCT